MTALHFYKDNYMAQVDMCNTHTHCLAINDEQVSIEFYRIDKFNCVTLKKRIYLVADEKDNMTDSAINQAIFLLKKLGYSIIQNKKAV